MMTSSNGNISALLALCAGNSPGTGEFPTQRPVTRSFDVSFDLCLNKRLSKQWWGWWFETLSRPLWRHRNDKSALVHVTAERRTSNKQLPELMMIKIQDDIWRRWGNNTPKHLYSCVERNINAQYRWFLMFWTNTVKTCYHTGTVAPVLPFDNTRYFKPYHKDICVCDVTAIVIIANKCRYPITSVHTSPKTFSI